MKGFGLTGEPGAGVVFTYLAPVETIWVGLWGDPEEKLYPAICLKYRHELIEPMVLIRREMEEVQQKPIVHIIKNSDVLTVDVAFVLRGASRALLEQITGEFKEQVLKQVGEEKVTVLAIAEADLSIREQETFLIPFERGDNFKLLIAGAEENQESAWIEELSSYRTETPNLQNLAL